MMKILKAKCSHCKKIENLVEYPWREFMVIEGKKNKKIVCQKCGYKIFIKKEADPRNLFYWPLGKPFKNM